MHNLIKKFIVGWQIFWTVLIFLVVYHVPHERLSTSPDKLFKIEYIKMHHLLEKRCTIGLTYDEWKEYYFLESELKDYCP